MSGSKTAERLISKLRSHGMLPIGPVELIRTVNKRGGTQWQWEARNPVTKTKFQIGSPHSMSDLLKAPRLIWGPDGKTVIPFRPVPRKEQFRAYPCECGAKPGEYCIVSGRRSANSIHMDRIRKYDRDHKGG